MGIIRSVIPRPQVLLLVFSFLKIKNAIVPLKRYIPWPNSKILPEMAPLKPWITTTHRLSFINSPLKGLIWSGIEYQKPPPLNAISWHQLCHRHRYSFKIKKRGLGDQESPILQRIKRCGYFNLGKTVELICFPSFPLVSSQNLNSIVIHHPYRLALYLVVPPSYHPKPTFFIIHCFGFNNIFGSEARKL